MLHVGLPEAGGMKNRLQNSCSYKLTSGVLVVCHANLVAVSSDARFWRRLD